MLQRVNRIDPPNRARRSARGERSLPWEAAGLIAVAFALRAAYATLALGPHATPSSDSLTYDTVAWNLARGLGFSLDGARGHYPTAFVPPVMPWLTSLLYRAVGHRYFDALLLQCAVGACVPALLASFARSTFGSGVARWAGWLAAFNPLLVFFSGYLLTESTFCFTLLLALFMSVEWVKTPRPGRALGAGLCWGLAALTRPTALPMPLVVAAWAWVPLGLTLAARDRVRQLVLLALGVALAVGPWTLRNAAALRAFVPVTTGGGRSLLDANNPLVWDDPARRGGAISVYDIEPWASRLRGLPEPQADARSAQMARAFALARLRQWPAVALAKLGRFWRVTSEGGGTGHWGARPGAMGRILSAVDPLLVWSLIVWPLAIGGLVVTLRGAKRLFLALPALAVVAFSLGTVVFWGSLRLRVPIEPLIVLYAAAGADAMVRRRRMRRSGLRVIEGGAKPR